MTQARIRSIYSLAIWTTVAVVFSLVFFGWGGPAEFASNSLRILISALEIGFGIISYVLMLIFTRKKFDNLQDERDYEIAQRVNGTTLVAVLVFVYAAEMILFAFFQTSGTVPVGWLWFLAYFTACFSYITHAIITLALYKEMS